MRALVFDLDGTLLDSLADIGNACNHMLEEKGFPTHPLQAYRQMVGNGFTILVERALPPDRDIDQHEREACVAIAREFYAAHMADATKPYPGMMDTLRRLAADGVILAVLSNKPDNLSLVLIKRFFPDIPFAHVHGARPGVPLKPDPTALKGMLGQLKAKEALYCGDSDVDVITAHNAGLKAIGAAWGFRGEAELVRAGADYVFQEPAELPGMFESLCR